MTSIKTLKLLQSSMSLQNDKCVPKNLLSHQLSDIGLTSVSVPHHLQWQCSHSVASSWIDDFTKRKSHLEIALFSSDFLSLYVEISACTVSCNLYKHCKSI